MAFSIERFVEDCRAVRGRPDWPQAIAGLLREAVTHAEALDALAEERGAIARKGFDVWAQSDDLTIYMVDGRPGLVSPPHDHDTVAVVAIYRGAEGYQNFRVEDGRLEPAGRVTVTAPDVSVLPADLIHALDNSQTQGSRSIHVYGNGHFDLPSRRLWNPDTLEAAPFSNKQQFAWTRVGGKVFKDALTEG
jgi:predicted metal-dependent enzyme (double-stranded beta helix superfamily)